MTVEPRHCPACDKLVGVVERTGRLAAHRTPRGRSCAGSNTPAARAKRRQSDTAAEQCPVFPDSWGP